MKPNDLLHRLGEFVAIAILGLYPLVGAGPAFSGVPFVTDDPDTPEKGHFEINLGSQLTHSRGDTSGTAVGAEVNYGLLDQLELHVFAPLAFDSSRDTGTHFGAGDVELGVKYRFIEADDYGWRPAVALAPTISLPSGSSSHGLGTGRAHGTLPIWVSEEIKQWTVFGGGGYAVNPGPGNKNFWFSGIAVTREITPELTVGGEIIYNSPADIGGNTSVGFNLGGVYNLSDRDHLLFSAGRNFIHASENNLYSVFVGWQLTF
jgi:hypothetical protein